MVGHHASSEKTLEYSRALLELTVRENGAAMDTITRVFSEMASLFVDVERRCAELRAAAPGNAHLDSVSQDCAAATVALREGLRAVQLHDITDQRLSHLATLLGALSDGRDCEIASVLTDHEARALLELIENGVSSDEAFGQLGANPTARGSVELF